jgi:hypothetical protein
LIRSTLSRIGRAVRVVIHDPEVHRAGKSFAVLVAVRIALALGASAEMIDVARRILGV